MDLLKILCKPILLLLTVGTVYVATADNDTQSTKMMAHAAKNFIASLSGEQRAKTLFEFGDDARRDWHFIPKATRKGLSFKEMHPDQAQLAHVLLNVGLSAAGYSKALTIMTLEHIVREADERSGNTRMLALRDSELYFFSIFGEPSAEGTWAWSIEGHHVSLNFTIVEGKFCATTPAFFGANPHQVLDGPMKGLRVLKNEEDLARILLNSLTDEQRSKAILSDQAPREIFSGAKRKVEFEGPPKGLPTSAMIASQKSMIKALIEEYINNLALDLARARRANVEKADPEKIYFAWMGDTDKGIGHPHYYRVQGTTFLIEYDNIQNQANHSHTVWRDYDGDFGLDLLAQHYKKYRH